ncbi:type II toxin-antitoxin system PemK/MazF family toxin [Brevibacillus sp. AY1]|uniref:type II toxin-antitoxin system PemK/MazF family toxin n=1 Tax=Brevibacillus sp. AY1 TaxID=2807621 RepID=UPI002456F955|nr:type II toxin-antitoxin system PemK/MazF family toxin [Brevibacillus sp. AY1]MDH4620023.1 type II toxin-antitoxin system PemK/MazF family toxin [Brevibacillus sp. AY1]
MTYELGEVWYAAFPYEEDETKTEERPVVIIVEDEGNGKVSVAKITKTSPRDQYDIVLKHWKSAGLKRPSVVRTSKVVQIDISQIDNKKGELHEEDLEAVVESVLAYSEMKQKLQR